MKAAADMVDLKPLPGGHLGGGGAGEHSGQHRDMIEKAGAGQHAAAVVGE